MTDPRPDPPVPSRARLGRRTRLLAVFGALIAVAGGILAAHATAATALTESPPGTPVTAVSDRSVVQERGYGVLNGKPGYQSADDDAGITFYEIDVSWASWEPSPGQYDRSYQNRIHTQVQNYVEAGAVVSISVGLQDPPAWLTDLPDGTLRDQHGNVAPLAPNYAWSASVDQAVVRYIHNIVATLDPMVSQYRIGIGDAAETMYPDPPTNAPSTWWIGVKFSDLPPGLRPNPMPGWEPGTPTWNGEPVTPAKAERWYRWYLSGLKHTILSQGQAFRDAGFQGQLAFLAAGQGAEPWLLQERINAKLADIGNDSYGTVNTGVAFQHTIPYFVRNVSGPVVINATGAADGSGVPGERMCQPGDENVDISPGSTAMQDWSSTRWTHALARKFGAGFELESPTFNSPLPVVYKQFQTCQAQYLQWLNDESLNTSDGSDGYLTLERYAEWIAGHPLPGSR